MKQKKQDKKIKKGIKRKNVNIYFELISIIIIIPLFSFFILSILNKNNTSSVYRIPTNKTNIKISTDMNFYFPGENIKLMIENNSKKTIYFEPCEYLNKFEKKIGGKWRESFNYEGIKAYDKFGFKREKNITKCEIKLPKEGVGIYRTVIQIYYGCERPGEDMCRNSKAFYSNEFRVK